MMEDTDSKLENNDDSVNSNIDSNYEYGQHSINNNDEGETKDKISIKSNNGTGPNSQASLKSKASVVEKSSPVLPSTILNQNNWKSTNPFVNYIQDCRKCGFSGQTDHKNFFQFAGTQWRSMSTEQKQSYVNGAAMIKKQKRMTIKTAAKGQKRKRLRDDTAIKSADSTLKKAKNKELIKPKRVRKKTKKQRLYKNDSESDTASDNQRGSSDNESTISDEAI